jgi:hypothetical protein
MQSIYCIRHSYTGNKIFQLKRATKNCTKQIIKHGRESDCVYARRVYFHSPRVFPQRSLIDNFCYEGAAGKTGVGCGGGKVDGHRVSALLGAHSCFRTRENTNPLVGEIRANCMEKPKVARARPSLQLELVRALAQLCA